MNPRRRPPGDTIAAVATAPGRGGVGVLRLSGPAAFEVAAALTGELPSPRTAALRTFRDADGEALDRDSEAANTSARSAPATHPALPDGLKLPRFPSSSARARRHGHTELQAKRSKTRGRDVQKRNPVASNLHSKKTCRRGVVAVAVLAAAIQLGLGVGPAHASSEG